MKRMIFAALVTTALTACAGMPPGASDIARAPKINFGQPLPEGHNYVLHYPAGTPLPVTALVDGSLFERAESATFHVTLKHDIYVFRKFASLDGQNWQPGYKLIQTHLDLQIPQKDGSNAGLLHIKMDQK